MKLKRKKWAGKTMFAVLICILAISCGTWRVQAASDSSSKISASDKKNSISIKKGLVKEKGRYRYYVNNKPIRNKWKKIKGQYYWFCANGVAARGGSYDIKGTRYIFDMKSHRVLPGKTKVVKINKNWFIVDKYGRAVSGWQEVNGKIYYAYKSGRCVVNKTIGGLRLGRNGYAADSTQARCKIAARRFIANHTNSGMTNYQKLRACFNYIIAYNRFVGNMDPSPAEFKSRKWVYKYALQMFQNGLTGNCYGIASSVAAVAKELGYQPYVITLAEGHSFVMINGRYYDNMYGALFNAASRPAYVAQYKIKF